MGIKLFVPFVNQSSETGMEEIKALVSEPLNTVS